MTVVLVSFVAAVLAAAIARGWVSSHGLAQLTGWTALGTSVFGCWMVAMAWEQRGSSRSLLALAAVAIVTLGIVLVYEPSPPKSERASGTIAFVDTDANVSPPDRLPRSLWVYSGLLVLALFVSATAMHHTGKLRRLDATTDQLLTVVLGSRLPPPSHVRPLRPGDCFLHGSGWPDTEASEVVPCSDPHDWQALAVVDRNGPCPEAVGTVSPPHPARPEERIEGPDKWCYVRFPRPVSGALYVEGLAVTP